MQDKEQAASPAAVALLLLLSARARYRLGSQIAIIRKRGQKRSQIMEALDESGSWCRRQSDDSSNLGCEREANEEYANAGRAQTSLNSKQSKWNSSVGFLRTNPESLNSDIPQFVST